MRNSKRRSLEPPVRTNLSNPANAGAGTCLRRMLFGPILWAAAIMLFAVAHADSQGATNSISIKQIEGLVDRGQVDAAEKQLWEIVVRQPENTAAINLLGVIRTRQKRFPEAAALFKRVLAIAPDYIAAYRNLGELYAIQGRSEDAKAAYVKVHELDPRDAKTSLALGTICEETGEFERSIEVINSIPASLRPSAALPVMASDYFALKQPDKVAALAPLVRHGAGSDPSLIPRFARVLAENGFVDDAEELLTTATPHQKLTPEYLLALARVQERAPVNTQGLTFDEGLRLSKALRHHPQSRSPPKRGQIAGSGRGRTPRHDALAAPTRPLCPAA